MCKIKLKNVGGESCEPTAGMVGTIKIAPVSDFDQLQAIPDMGDDVDIDTLAVISGNHTFKDGKGFSVIEGVEESGDIKSTMIGDVGRRLFQNEAKIEVAGSGPRLLGWLRAVKNLKFISEHEEAGSGQIRQMGSRRSPARFGGIEHAIEAAMEGKNSVTLTITDKQVCPAPIYTGVMTDVPSS